MSVFEFPFFFCLKQPLVGSHRNLPTAPLQGEDTMFGDKTMGLGPLAQTARGGRGTGQTRTRGST